MPMLSQAQRSWMHINHPEMAKLPKHVQHKHAYFDPRSLADSLALAAPQQAQGDAQILAALQRTQHAPMLNSPELLTAELAQDDDPDDLQSPEFVDASRGPSGLASDLLMKDASFLDLLRRKAAEAVRGLKGSTRASAQAEDVEPLLRRIAGV